jgi:hypothetical protein
VVEEKWSAPGALYTLYIEGIKQRDPQPRITRSEIVELPVESMPFAFSFCEEKMPG